MKRAYIGLFGVVFGAILLIPSFMIGRAFSATDTASGPVIVGIQVTGALILVGVPLLYWVVLPVAERYHRNQDDV